ncbi:esterase/lipase family protein [Candidatus Protochlamydia phocaeensis]|uniref:esterase/lipase family protein n=1 Tax=Candidatus Protochlamydia phocaeensis TaxID=1414722 RepID=UPI000837F788|nr:alpha/beta hydrolase [Candidatus Protochlamydia phocaeensis]
MTTISTLSIVQHSSMCSCLAASQVGENAPSLIDRIYSLFDTCAGYYKQAVQHASQYLFRKGWVISHYMVASLFGEPGASISSAVRRLFGWKSSWEEKGFYDAGDAKSLDKLSAALENDAQENDAGYCPPVPVLLFHGVHSSPDIWAPWLSELQEAEKRKDIGHVITLQLPNEMQARMEVVRRVLADIANRYQAAFPSMQPQVDLIGHSKGGYAAHLAAFASDEIYVNGIERRWHRIDEHNPLVRKVISIAAPTWLCCEGQVETENRDIYPLRGFTPDQLETIHHCHDNIVDFVAIEDAISVTDSPLPPAQVYRIKHGHLGIICPVVCQLALSILKGA